MMAAFRPTRSSAAKSRRSPSTTSMGSPFLPRRTLRTWSASPAGNSSNSPGSNEESTKKRVMGVRVTNPLPENAPETVEEGASTTIVGLFSAGSLEPFKQIPLLRRKARRYHDVEDDLEVPTPAPPQPRHPVAPECERRTWLGARVHPHLFRPLQGGNIHLGPKRRVDEANSHAVDEILPITHEPWIFSNVDLHVEITGGRAWISYVPSARDPQPHAALDAFGHPQPPGLYLGDPPAATTVIAHDIDDAAASAARRAGLRRHHLPEDALAHRSYRTRAAAGRTHVRLRPPYALTDTTVPDNLNVDLTVRPERGLTKGDFDLDLSVTTTARALRGGGAEERAAERAVAEERLEDVLEAPERVPPAGVACGSRAARYLVAVGIVGAPGLRVREDLVGLGELLEALFGLVVARVRIGVVITGQPTVRLLDLRVRGFPGHAQDLVVIALSSQLEPGVQTVGQGLRGRADRGYGGIVVHPFRADEADDPVRTLAMIVGRSHEARARQVQEAALGAYGDDDPAAGNGAFEGVAHQAQKPAPPFENLDHRRKAARVEVVQTAQEGRGALDEDPALRRPSERPDGFQDRPKGHRVVVRERRAGRETKLEVVPEGTASEPGVECREDLAQFLVLDSNRECDRGARRGAALHRDDEQKSAFAHRQVVDAG